MLTLCNAGLDMRKENKLYKELYLPQRACNIVEEMRSQHREACNQLPIMSHGSLPFPKILKKVRSLWAEGIRKAHRFLYSYNRRVLEARYHLDKGNGNRKNILEPCKRQELEVQ